MKNILSALYDSMLIFVLLFIVVASFIATFALSPVPYKESLLARNDSPILGEEDQAKLRFQDTYEEHDYFKVDSVHDERSYTSTIKVGPMSGGTVDKALLEIFNDSKITRQANVELKVPQSDASGIDIELEAADFSIKANEQKVLDIGPESSYEVSFYVNSKSRINFPIEVSVNISLK